jgi:hypothetical protein
MRRFLFVLPCLALPLAACGQKSEQAFNDTFDRNFVNSCVASATKSGVPTDLAGKVCSCASTEIGRKFTAREKLTMTEDQAKPIMAACLKTIQPPVGDANR